MHELRENFRQQDDPDMQLCLDELHDGVVDGVAWDVLLPRVVGLAGNHSLKYTTHDSVGNAIETTPCIPPTNEVRLTSGTRSRSATRLTRTTWKLWDIVQRNIEWCTRKPS